MDTSPLPPGIRRVKNGYQVDVQEGGIRRKKTVLTLEEACQQRVALRAELCARPKHVKLLQDCYDQAMREQWSRSKSKHSLKGTLYNAAIVMNFFGADTPVPVITRSDIAAFDEYLRTERNIADSTINRYHAPLSTMLTIAEEHGWIDRKPVIKHMREGMGRVRWLDEREETLILGQLTQWGMQDHVDAMVVLLDTGVRNGELWDLDVRDSNLNTRMIHIWRNKTDLPRSLPMTQRVYEVLARRSAHHTTKLFPYDNRWFRRMWERAKMMVGIKDDHLVPYCCRHTCATRLLQRGMELPKLQQWLGHKSLQMTMRYAHLSPTALAKGAQLLEQKEVPYDTRVKTSLPLNETDSMGHDRSSNPSNLSRVFGV